MTKLLEEAIATVQGLPEREQDIAARFLLAFANPEVRRYQLSEPQAAEVELAQREVREGKLASDADMVDVWRRFDH